MEGKTKVNKCKRCEQTIRNCDKVIENLHKHYGYFMETLAPIERIHLSYCDDNDMHFVSSISVNYSKKGGRYEKTERFAPGTVFSKRTLVATFNKLLEEIIAENSYKGGT